MKIYTTYEETEITLSGQRSTRYKTDWERYYNSCVNKREYPSFACWLEDMIRTGILKEDSPEWRIDSFKRKHPYHFFFYSEADAISFGQKEAENGGIVFLLRHLSGGVFDVIREVI